jgi:hypothetical protein
MGSESEAIITQGPRLVSTPPQKRTGAGVSKLQALREFIYGFYGYEFERQALEMRGELESVFLLLTLGDMLGVPIVPPLYSLRILPYAVPQIESWKRRTVRERDLCDKEEFHLHGV